MQKASSVQVKKKSFPMLTAEPLSLDMQRSYCLAWGEAQAAREGFGSGGVCLVRRAQANQMVGGRVEQGWSGVATSRRQRARSKGKMVGVFGAFARRSRRKATSCGSNAASVSLDALIRLPAGPGISPGRFLVLVSGRRWCCRFSTHRPSRAGEPGGKPVRFRPTPRRGKKPIRA